MYVGAEPTAPVVPVSVIVTASDNNSLTVQWEIPSISCTPETYCVEYGTQDTVLDSQSVTVLDKIVERTLGSLARSTLKS